jgi:hypothetical protein
MLQVVGVRGWALSTPMTHWVVCEQLLADAFVVVAEAALVSAPAL